MTALLTWLFGSFLQEYMFYGATSFNQDLSGWRITLDSNTVVSAIYLIFERVLHCINPQPSH